MNSNEEIPLNSPQETPEPDIKETVSWILNVVLKVGAGYLAKVILDALGL